MKSISLSLALVLPLCVTVFSCETEKIRTTLTWSYSPFSGQPTEHDLVSAGSGYAWRERLLNSIGLDVTRPILFENSQRWKTVNCGVYFRDGERARNGCGNGTADIGLLGHAGKGRIGSLRGPPGVWAVYDLFEFKITPVVDGEARGEVRGWTESGEQVKTKEFKVEAGEARHTVALPKGEWDRILQWQVMVRVGGVEVGFLIDDVVIEEYAISPSQPVTCTFPIQTPTNPPGPRQTLKFDDLPEGPIPTPYHGYRFLPPYVVVSNASAPSLPNVLSPLWNSSIPDSIFLRNASMFDVHSFHISIPFPLPVSEIWVLLTSTAPCFDASTGTGNSAGDSANIDPPAHRFMLNASAYGFEKYKAFTIKVVEKATFRDLPFQIDNLVLRSWGERRHGGLGFPACERCGKFFSDMCEYPQQLRPPH